MPTRHAFVFFFLLLGVFTVLPSTVVAAVIDSQPDSSSDRTINNNTAWGLGQGLLKINFGTSGNGKEIKIRYARNHADTDLGGNFPMYECTAGYNSSCTQVGSFVANHTPPNDGAYYDVILTNATPVTIDPVKYYHVIFNTPAFFVDRLKTDGAGNTYFVLDSGIVAPSTNFNEVIDYIYDPVLNNSVGTSTVGARFSIPQPDWLSYYGFEIRGPLGNILYSGSNEATVSGTFDVDVEWYFDVAGAYEIVAWFENDTGIKTYNPVSVYITVNAEPWVYDPVTGDLVPVSSTTIATSTLTNFKIECPDDVLVGSLCKLAVGLFIPKASSITGIQAAFSGIMGKAPFSFFTQSKTILDAFRLGETTTGGALELTLYSNEITILSQNTGDAIGIDSGVIDVAKSVMIVGLWLMLAWYLYWRIASIFGV